MVYMLGLRPFRLRIRIEVKLTTKKTVNATVNPIKREKSFSTISWAEKVRIGWILVHETISKGSDI